MKPLYVILLMGAAAVAGGFLVRHRDRPVHAAAVATVPPTVVAPPIPPNAHIGPSTSVPVHPAPPEKPSAFDVPVHVSAKPAPPPVPAAPVARKQDLPLTASVRIPPDPPAVTHIEHTIVVPVPNSAPAPPAPAAVVPPAPSAAPPQVAPPPAPEPNRATLRAGLLISVRINQALSSNLNSPGDVFSGILDRPLVADGFVIAERGAKVRGEVLASKSDAPSPELTLRLREILASDGQRVHVVTEPWRAAGVYNRYPATAPNPYDGALTRNGAAVIRPATTVTFRLGETVEISERR